MLIWHTMLRIVLLCYLAHNAQKRLFQRYLAHHAQISQYLRTTKSVKPLITIIAFQFALLASNSRPKNPFTLVR